MRIYQPMLFVGLGGTGCKVGAEFERRLREELCGPDGTRLLERMRGRDYLPYQLPSCLQFVYADLSSAELARVRREVIPGIEHEVAAQRTMRTVTDLVPARLANSAEVAQSLRLNLRDEEIAWLPPKVSDPRIGPLHAGAGQLPTVGRAVLFETLRRNADTAVKGIKDALADINESAGDLYIVSDNRSQRVDPVTVFVVFSVAGGTGSGIFYDYLHLIGAVLQDGHKQFQIYPLVLMPSAFDDGKGGGRPAELNAGSALVDLFRLIDDQNAQGSPERVSTSSGYDNAVAVRYPPPRESVKLNPNTVQTAFLFGRPVGGVKRDDLTRSMVSLMLSLVGAGVTDEDQDEVSSSNTYQSFADGFINKSVERYQTAETGVGRRGVSASSVAALTTPLFELTDIVSSRLLARAVTQLTEPFGPAEKNAQHLLRFLVGSGLERLRHAEPVARVPEGQGSIGREAVIRRLSERARAIDANIVAMPAQLAEPVAERAQNFDPVSASRQLLQHVDLFHLQRILFGHRELVDQLDKDGFGNLLENYRIPPPAPSGFNVAGPPQPQNLPKRFVSRLKWDDPAVQEVCRAQDDWYAWRSRQIWNMAWGDSYRLWKRVWDEFGAEFRAVSEAFDAYARSEPQQFDVRSKELYKPRVGVSYLLPPQDKGVAGFYDVVFERLKQDYSARLGVNAREGEMLREILGQEGWSVAYDAGRKSPEAAVAVVRQKIKEAVAERIRPRNRDRVALIPRMEDLLASAAQRRDSSVSDVDLRQFRQKLAELVPGGFAPEGHAKLKVLFTYPALEEDRELQDFLRREVPLPVDLIDEPEFRAIQADSMVVVLMRTSMGITEVPEVRGVMKLWSEALRHDKATDALPWRQRLGPYSDYLVMTDRDCAEVLHRLLCAAWNGQLQVVGAPSSPISVSVDLGSLEAVKMELDLSPLGELSSWASLLQAYERWLLADDRAVRRNLAKRLMEALPDHLTTSPSPPAEEFNMIVCLDDNELNKIRKAQRDPVLSNDPQLRIFSKFWGTDLPAALGRRLDGTAKTLELLPRAVRALDGVERADGMSRSEGDGRVDVTKRANQ
ncbi:MAG: tubulin-like doman-containing protein [Pseudonocardiaceae bacterium]